MLASSQTSASPAVLQNVQRPPVPFDMLMLITVVDGDPLGITAIGEVLRVALARNLLKVSGPGSAWTVGPLAGTPKLEKKKLSPLNWYSKISFVCVD